jgi:hypothetical protein
LNTGIDSDDGNPESRGKAPSSVAGMLQSIIVRGGQEKGEIRPVIDTEELAALIIITFESSLMMSRSQPKEHPLTLACRYPSGSPGSQHSCAGNRNPE